uniref:Odorant-binding protein 26 n=1 Tax=Lygus lineolaris TaxID=50650 RepID=W0HI14_LYGLI|nr:odorant-binding protein 26 [Lygus lineolaris]
MNQSSCILTLALTIVAMAVVSGFKELDSVLPQAKQEECRKESNFQGELSGDLSQNVTQELKCFAACSLVKLGLMNEKDGTINTTQLDELIAKHTEGKDAADMFKHSVVEPCLKEVNKTADYCEYSFQLVTCGMNKVKPPTTG